MSFIDIAQATAIFIFTSAGCRKLCLNSQNAFSVCSVSPWPSPDARLSPFARCQCSKRCWCYLWTPNCKINAGTTVRSVSHTHILHRLELDGASERLMRLDDKMKTRSIHLYTAAVAEHVPLLGNNVLLINWFGSCTRTWLNILFPFPLFLFFFTFLKYPRKFRLLMNDSVNNVWWLALPVMRIITNFFYPILLFLISKRTVDGPLVNTTYAPVWH